MLPKKCILYEDVQINQRIEQPSDKTQCEFYVLKGRCINYNITLGVGLGRFLGCTPSASMSTELATLWKASPLKRNA